jgi:lipid II:glycine glycyltransferase (peptidoglycan interpeptide bridge formation enzyme)
VNLSPGLEDIKHAMAYSFRKLLKQAERAGVRVAIAPLEEHLETFMDLYNQTMNRTGATPRYFFPEFFYRELSGLLRDHTALAVASHKTKIVAAELVLLSKKRAYSFLAGSTQEARTVRANNLIKLGLIEWLKEEGYTHFILGGGLAPDDGIFRFKQSIAPHGTVAFRTGQHVFLEEVYSKLVTCKRNSHALQGRSWQPERGFFPQYRAPNEVD